MCCRLFISSLIILLQANYLYCCLKSAFLNCSTATLMSTDFFLGINLNTTSFIMGWRPLAFTPLVFYNFLCWLLLSIFIFACQGRDSRCSGLLIPRKLSVSRPSSASLAPWGVTRADLSSTSLSACRGYSLCWLDSF
jgi:hypothetical protein